MYPVTEHDKSMSRLVTVHTCYNTLWVEDWHVGEDDRFAR